MTVNWRPSTCEGSCLDHTFAPLSLHTVVKPEPSRFCHSQLKDEEIEAQKDSVNGPGSQSKDVGDQPYVALCYLPPNKGSLRAMVVGRWMWV